MAPQSAARRPSPRRRASGSPTEVVQLHPLIRARLGQVDLQRTDILKVEEGLAVDVILRNRRRY